MSAQWFYTKNGQRMGPVTDAELKQLAASGTILPTDQIWKEGMSAWTNAGNIKSLFSNSAPEQPISNKAQDSVVKAGQSVLSKLGNIADKVGKITGEAINYDQNVNEETNVPGVLLKEKYFGGRQRIGTSLQQLSTTGGKVMSSIFSFAYMGFIVFLSLSAWVFLPFSNTDFIRISLKQSLRWEKLLPIITSWFVTISFGFIFTFALLILNNKFSELISSFTTPSAITEQQVEEYREKQKREGNNITSRKARTDLEKQSSGTNSILLAINSFLSDFRITLNYVISSLMLLFYIYANLGANSKLASLINYTRTSITLDYGFPNKVRLLSTVTDASIESQIESVLALCNAIEKAQFAPWELVNRDRNNGIRTYISTLARRLTG
jgi:hypothetical protein